MSNQAYENTDKELWRERDGDYYADSIHVTKEGRISIDVGGQVFVKALREWHRLAVRDALSKCPGYEGTDTSPTCRHCGMSIGQHAALSALAPEGWQLVPKEPTEEMLDRAVAFALNVSLSDGYRWTDYMRDLWKRFLSAPSSGGGQP